MKLKIWLQKRCYNFVAENDIVMKKDVMILTGAGQIGMAIARRLGYGMKIVVGDKRIENAETVCNTMNEAGFDSVPTVIDLSLRNSIHGIIKLAKSFGDITMLVNAAGVSPSQAPIEAILKVDLYGTAVLLEEVGKVIAEGGAGVTILSQCGRTADASQRSVYYRGRFPPRWRCYRFLFLRTSPACG